MWFGGITPLETDSHSVSSVKGRACVPSEDSVKNNAGEIQTRAEIEIRRSKGEYEQAVLQL